MSSHKKKKGQVGNKMRKRKEREEDVWRFIPNKISSGVFSHQLGDNNGIMELLISHGGSRRDSRVQNKRQE